MSMNGCWSPVTTVMRFLKSSMVSSTSGWAGGSIGPVIEGKKLVSLDGTMVEIVTLSLRVSLAAVLISGVVGLPLGALLAVSRFQDDHDSLI